MTTLEQKVNISLGSAMLFALLNLPVTYKLTDSFFPYKLYNKSSGCPTHMGLLVHTVVFFVITYLTMGDAEKSDKIRNSLYGTLIFFFISSPMMYSVVASIFGSKLASQMGCQTFSGVFLHAAVYFLALVAVMYLP
jgi:hypothetical protein